MKTVNISLFSCHGGGNLEDTRRDDTFLFYFFGPKLCTEHLGLWAVRYNNNEIGRFFLHLLNRINNLDDENWTEKQRYKK